MSSPEVERASSVEPVEEEEVMLCHSIPDMPYMHGGYFPEMVEYHATGPCEYSISEVWIHSFGVIPHDPKSSMCQRTRDWLELMTDKGFGAMFGTPHLIEAVERPAFMDDECDDMVIEEFDFMIGCYGDCEQCALNPMRFGKYRGSLEMTVEGERKEEELIVDMTHGKNLILTFEAGHTCTFEARRKINAQIDMTLAERYAWHLGNSFYLELPTETDSTYFKKKYDATCKPGACCPYEWRDLSSR